MKCTWSRGDLSCKLQLRTTFEDGLRIVPSLIEKNMSKEDR
jgi:hypothetical protein